MTATDLISRSHSIAPSNAVAARLREAANNDFQSHLIPPREALAWQQPAPPVQIARAAPTPLTAGSIDAPAPRELALMADDVYNDIPAPPPGYRVATESDLARIGLSPQDLSSPQSAFRARVYLSGEGASAQYVVSFRGSTDASDWKANAQQAVGLPSDQYARALMLAKAIGRHPDANVTLTGHSLGGGLASAAALASGRDAATFNAAGLSDATIDRARAIRGNTDSPAPEIAAFYVRGEILSAVQDGGDRVLGAIFGGPLGGLLADAPEAYGDRIPLDAVRPQGQSWYQDNPVARHGMDWVLSSLPVN
ncbi:lipase family protein [Sphingomonas sp. DT-207]|uniref:lipase family protein n=1 Tax=Sphingomonas sp. DT-207 TaxID=3396167 RepID=UPI003F1BC69A